MHWGGPGPLLRRIVTRDCRTRGVEARVAGMSSAVTTDTTNDTYRVVAMLTPNSAAAITDVGLFDDSTGGNMYEREMFAAINLEQGDSIQFTIDAQYKAPWKRVIWYATT